VVVVVVVVVGVITGASVVGGGEGGVVVATVSAEADVQAETTRRRGARNRMGRGRLYELAQFCRRSILEATSRRNSVKRGLDRVLIWSRGRGRSISYSAVTLPGASDRTSTRSAR